MIFVNKKMLVIILIFISNIVAQNSLKHQFDYANELFNQEKYFDAITEYKRLQFFDKENIYAFESNLLIGNSYKAGAKFDEAIRYFTAAEMHARNEIEYYNSNILSARVNILRGTTKQAEKILTDLLDNPKFISDTEEIKYWMGWSYIFSDEWEKAHQIFNENNLDTSLANICKSVNEEFYNKDFAKYSSYIIPGFGQFYTREYLSGTLSLGWNVLFGYLTINSIILDRVLDGIMVGNFLWLRFYSGNTQNAEKFAIEKNLQISNKALKYLQSDFTGKRP
jgi:hypothetical protein